MLSFNQIKVDDSDNNIEETKKVLNFDITIIGGGPAGVTAAVYAKRKGWNTAIVTKNVGGQVSDTAEIENYTGFPMVQGYELSFKFKEQIDKFDIETIEGYDVSGITKLDDGTFEVSIEDGTLIKSKIVIVAAGKSWIKLNVPGEDKFFGRGVSVCATCDAPFYKNKIATAVGGGNSGVEAAIELAKVASKVYLVHRRDEFRADQILIDKMKATENIELVLDSVVTEVKGDNLVKSVEVINRKTNEKREFDTNGVFVEIGLIPNTQFLKGLVKLNEKNEIIVDALCQTDVEGLYAAGDITNVEYKQIVIATGEGAKAALSACDYLMREK